MQPKNSIRRKPAFPDVCFLYIFILSALLPVFSIQTAVLHCFGNVAAVDHVTLIQIGNCPRDL